jgi:hypothetical protein
MRRGAAFALLLIVAALAGCGGGSSSTDATTATAGPAVAEAGRTVSEAPPNRAVTKAKPKRNGEARRAARQSAQPANAAPSAPPTDPAPLPNEGTAAVAPGVPTVKGGDNSIQRYGTEASSGERVRAAATAAAYLRANAAGDWGRSCSYLEASLRVHLEQVASRQLGGEAGCAKAMAALVAVPASTLRRAADIDAISMRISGDHGFLIYRDGAGAAANLPMVLEGGQWKVSSLSGIELRL